MTTENILSILIAHFKNTNWPFGVNEAKLYDRSSIFEDPDKPGWHIVKIERHRGALNASYRKGQPMAAFETYWMRYAVHQETGEVAELPAKSDEFNIDNIGSLVDQALSEMVDLSINLIETGKYLIEDNISKYEEIISTYEEAEEFALKLAIETADAYLMRIEESSDISEDQLNQLKAEFPEYFKGRIVNKVAEVWEDREIEDEEA